MIRNGRSSDQNFLPTDHLYYRCVLEDIDEYQRLIPLRIKYKNTSVNWSKYSKPWDVIFDHPGAGIVRFVVRDLPRQLPTEGTGKPHYFQSSHEPEEDNFSHSEIQTYKDGKRFESADLPSMVKKEFRQILSEGGMLLVSPKV